MSVHAPRTASPRCEWLQILRTGTKSALTEAFLGRNEEIHHEAHGYDAGAVPKARDPRGHANPFPAEYVRHSFRNTR